MELQAAVSRWPRESSFEPLAGITLCLDACGKSGGVQVEERIGADMVERAVLTSVSTTSLAQPALRV